MLQHILLVLKIIVLVELNFISASRQGNFRDLEVKNNANNATILLSGGTSGVSGGDISITGTLSTDTISEKTSGSGVTIDSVLLKDNNVTAHTIGTLKIIVLVEQFLFQHQDKVISEI